MSRPSRVTSPLVVIDATLGTALWRQIYDQLRDAIVSGRLPSGARLPASRALATDLVVSRNSVTTAYDQLRAEGYLEQRERLGTFVTSVLPDLAGRPRAIGGAMRRQPLPGSAVASDAGASADTRQASLSPSGAVFVAAAERLVTPAGVRVGERGMPIPFRTGDPAIDAFPIVLWGRLAARRWRAGHMSLGYSDAAGARPLREAIAAYLTTSRGVRCDPRQVFIASGTQQAIDLATRLVLSASDTVWVEDPGYPGARSAIEGAGATVIPVPVDQFGMMVAEGIREAPQARAAYVTPSHQFPLGMVMSVARRLELLEWAAAVRAWIIEDDYDSEFRYSSRPLPSLQGLDEHGRVIYVGTFSKTLFPALRLAYVVAPPSLVDAFQAACSLGGRYAPTDTQLVVTDFITEGHFERHLRRMRALYARRQEALLSDIETYLSEWFAAAPNAAGLHLVAWLKPPRLTARAVSATAALAGIELGALSNYTRRTLDRDAVLLGYGAFSPERLRSAAQRLAGVLERGRVPESETMGTPNRER